MGKSNHIISKNYVHVIFCCRHRCFSPAFSMIHRRKTRRVSSQNYTTTLANFLREEGSSSETGELLHPEFSKEERKKKKKLLLLLPDCTLPHELRGYSQPTNSGRRPGHGLPGFTFLCLFFLQFFSNFSSFFSSFSEPHCHHTTGGV